MRFGNAARQQQMQTGKHCSQRIQLPNIDYIQDSL